MLSDITNIRYLKGVGEKRAQHLYSLGIDTIGALLRYFPRGYEDFSNIKQIFDCSADEKVCVKARIITPIVEHKIRSNMTLYKFKISDGTAYVQVTIFNNKYFCSNLQNIFVLLEFENNYFFEYLDIYYLHLGILYFLLDLNNVLMLVFEPSFSYFAIVVANPYIENIYILQIY